MAAIGLSDTVFAVVTAANTRLNGKVETLSPIGGQIIGNTTSFSQQVVNDAWRKFQNRLADLRFSGLQQEAVFLDVPAVGSTDPVNQAFIDFTQYWDGAASHGAPVLPPNLIRPYELNERTNGSGALFTEMDEVPHTLPRVPKANWNRQWVWRSNAIYLPGALVATDMSLLYAALLLDFVDNGTTPWFQQLVSIMYCLDPFADYICREVCIARGDLAGATAFQQSAEDGARMIVGQDSTNAKSIGKESEYGRMSDRFTPNNLPDTEPVKR